MGWFFRCWYVLCPNSLIRLLILRLAGVEPRYMGVGPIPAIRKVLERTGLTKEEVDVYEVDHSTRYSPFVELT